MSSARHAGDGLFPWHPADESSESSLKTAPGHARELWGSPRWTLRQILSRTPLKTRQVLRQTLRQNFAPNSAPNSAHHSAPSSPNSTAKLRPKLRPRPRAKLAKFYRQTRAKLFCLTFLSKKSLERVWREAAGGLGASLARGRWRPTEAIGGGCWTPSEEAAESRWRPQMPLEGAGGHWRTQEAPGGSSRLRAAWGCWGSRLLDAAGGCWRLLETAGSYW